MTCINKYDQVFFLDSSQSSELYKQSIGFTYICSFKIGGFFICLQQLFVRNTKNIFFGNLLSV